MSLRGLVPEAGRRHHVWMAPTTLETLAKLAEGLRDDEVHVWQIQYQRCQGRTPLRRVLAAYLGMHADDVILTEEEHGRPSLAPALDQSLGFNWSHSGNHALIAVGRHVKPGVDVERLRPRPRALEIAQRYFTSEEVRALLALQSEQRHTAFLELWTAKEAVLKAVGRGIAFGLDRLHIVCTPDELALARLQGEEVGQWQLQRLALKAGLIGALAWKGEPRPVRQRLLAIDD